MNHLIGQTISHYKITQLVGQGGMGEVYLAEDIKLKRNVAIKFLPSHLTKDNESRERFEREAQSAAALNHPNIVTIYEISEYEDPDMTDKQIYISMEYIEGKTLKELVIENGQLPIENSLNIAIQICEGLEKAHEAGIVHRDIKPGNIIIDKDNRVKILDFGLAKLKGVSQLTKETSTLGTIHYMPPQQLNGEDLDHRADIWSLGVVLYEMLTGELPFKGEYEQAVMYSIANKDPAPLSDVRMDVSEKLQEIVNKCLRKNTSDRYQDCKEILADLKRNVEEIALSSRENNKQSVHKNKRFLLLFPLFLVLLIFIIWHIVNFNKNNQLESIAILPFQNNSQDTNLEFLSKEIPANIINSLSRLPSLRVVPRTTAFRYADRESDLSVIGKELEVRSVLTGEVNAIKDNLMIRADLVNIEDNRQIWGDRFERKFSDLLDIEEEITREISEALPLHLTGEQKSNLIKRYTENIEAYRTFMEGRFWWNKRSPEGLAKAELLFKKAIEIDPNYALAHAGLAECYCMISMHMAKPEPVIRQARLAAEKALSIDESLAEAHTALAWIKFTYDWDWLGAERSFKQAIQLNPRYAIAYNWYAVLLSIINRHEEAIQYMSQAQKYDPGSAIINRDLGIVYAWAGDYTNAIKQLQFTIDMEPDFSPAYFLMGVVHMYLEKYDVAIDYLKKVESMTGNFFDIVGSLGFAYTKMGQKEAALGELRKLEDLNRKQDARASEFCFIHLGLGNDDQAFEWLDIACKNREFAVLILVGCESELWFENLSTDPRLKEVITRMGLEK